VNGATTRRCSIVVDYGTNFPSSFDPGANCSDQLQVNVFGRTYR
jgi:hypothetical protein